MEVVFDRSFSKALGRLKNSKVLDSIENIIVECE